MDLSCSKGLLPEPSGLQTQALGSEFPEHLALFLRVFTSSMGEHIAPALGGKDAAYSCGSLGCSALIPSLLGTPEVEWWCRAWGQPFAPQSVLLGARMVEPLWSGFQGRILPFFFFFFDTHVDVTHSHARSPFREERGQSSEIKSFTEPPLCLGKLLL